MLRKIQIFLLDYLLLKWSGTPKVAKTGAMSVLQHGDEVIKAAKMSV